jgi:hypothetical protein
MRKMTGAPGEIYKMADGTRYKAAEASGKIASVHPSHVRELLRRGCGHPVTAEDARETADERPR